MKDDFKRFDMNEPPRKMKWYLKPIMKLIAAPTIKKNKPIVTIEGMENIKEPYLLLINHNAFLDVIMTSHILGNKNYNSVVAIDGFIGREGLLRNVGCICKRKFTNDITLIKNLKRAANMGNIVVIYPEARYSLCGTTAVLPESLGKLCKFMKLPVAVITYHGHHINSPFWDTSHTRDVNPIEANMRLLFTLEDLNNFSADELNSKIVDAFQYDDFAWQKERGILVKDPNRAKGLHRVLYQCPHCKKEYRMMSEGINLYCRECGINYEMKEDGSLECTNGETIFNHIPDWYEWERLNVRKEVEDETYSITLNVSVESLPNAKKFIPLGNGTMTHNMNGFEVNIVDKDGDAHSMVKPVNSMYSCHIEYQYLFKHGDCVDLNTLNDTWYIYPEGEDFAVTKMALATEELYRHNLIKSGATIKKGLL